MADEVRIAPTDALEPEELRRIRALLDAAFGTGDEQFQDEDWRHALDGMHFVLEVDGALVSHASVVERRLEIGGRPFRTGYVEAVATQPDRQGEGFGTTVMRDATAYVRETFELGALGTGEQGFYERLGWTTWAGPSRRSSPTSAPSRTRSPWSRSASSGGAWSRTATAGSTTAGAT